MDVFGGVGGGGVGEEVWEAGGEEGAGEEGVLGGGGDVRFVAGRADVEGQEEGGGCWGDKGREMKNKGHKVE